MTERAQRIMEAFYLTFADKRQDFIVQKLNDDAIANVLQHLIDEHSEVRGTGRVDKKSQVVSVKTLMKLIEELK